MTCADRLKAPQRLETQRLVLRKPASADADGIYARYAGDAQVTRFLSWPRHRSVDETHAFIEFSDTQWRDYPAGPYLIESRTGLLLGGTGLRIEGVDRAATGYVLARDAWGLGYATEALKAMISVAREVELRELYAICHVNHAASQRVLEKCRFSCSARLDVHFPNLSAGESRTAALRYALALR